MGTKKDSSPVGVLIVVLGAVIGVAAGFVGIIALSSAINGWALMLLWNWFAVPLLGVLPIVSIPAAIGLGLVVSTLMARYIPTGKDNTWAPIIFLFVQPLAAVLFGYLLRRFFM